MTIIKFKFLFVKKKSPKETNGTSFKKPLQYYWEWHKNISFSGINNSNVRERYLWNIFVEKCISFSRYNLLRISSPPSMLCRNKKGSKCDDMEMRNFLSISTNDPMRHKVPGKNWNFSFISAMIFETLSQYLTCFSRWAAADMRIKEWVDVFFIDISIYWL